MRQAMERAEGREREDRKSGKVARRERGREMEIRER